MGSVESRWSRVVSGTQLPRIFFREGGGGHEEARLFTLPCAPFITGFISLRGHLWIRATITENRREREKETRKRLKPLRRLTVSRWSTVSPITEEKNLGKRRKERSGGRKKDGELKQSHFQDLNIETRHRLCSPLFSPLCVQPAYTLFLSLPVELSNDETGEWKEREK